MISRQWRNMHKYYNPVDSSTDSTGKIVTYTVLRDVPTDSTREENDILVADAPLVLAIIEFADKKRLFTQIVDCSPEEVKIGQQVKQVFRKMRMQGARGIIEYGYKHTIVK